MNLLKSKTFKIPGGELEKIIVTENSIVYFTKVYGKGFYYKLQMQTIDSTFNESSSTVIADSDDFNNEAVDFRIEYNQKKSNFLIWYLMDSGDSTFLKYHFCNKNKVLLEGSKKFAYSLSELYIGDAVIDDSGNLYMIYSQSEKFRSKNSDDFMHFLYAFNLRNGKILNEKINNSETFISSYKITYNYKLNTVNASGFHGNNDEDEDKGYFCINLDCASMKLINVTFKDIDRKLVTRILGVKNEQKGENLSKFKIKKLVPKLDGGTMIIAERTYVTTQSEIFYVNGIPQSSYAKIFNNDEVLIFNLDSNGNTLWSDVIIKNQSTVNDGGYYNGIIIVVQDDRVNILYNDKLNANADIIQVTYLSNGEYSKKILLNNDQFFALVIPAEYNQVTSNSVVIPINQNRDYTYIKLLY